MEREYSLEDCSSFLLINLFCFVKSQQNAAPQRPLFLRFFCTRRSTQANPSLTSKTRGTHHYHVNCRVHTTSQRHNNPSTCYSRQDNAATQHIHPIVNKAHPPRRSAQQIDISSLSFLLFCSTTRQPQHVPPSFEQAHPSSPPCSTD